MARLLVVFEVDTDPTLVDPEVIAEDILTCVQDDSDPNGDWHLTEACSAEWRA